MKKQILITGGLGYIGYELCKIYSGSSWSSQIIVIDKNFFSERVKQLTDWNIKFYQGDILDNNFISKFVPNADVIHHLAGITNVAYVKSDKNLERDNLIKATAIQGTNNILKLMKADAKIIFPSTHVVFDGLNKTEKLITETRKKNPTLAYSISKSQNEDDIIKSKKNYVILRLASVYGFSADSTRIQIVPNLFSKITAENGTIRLFGKGVQLKSLVSLIDVVRCFKFMEENNKVNKEIFHISKENLTIKDIALKCKKINPKVKIIETNDEIPNKGYTIDSKKIKKTGFNFLYNLENSLEEMIHNWKNKNKPEDLEYLKQGEKEYIDKRGKISNYELTEPINLIGLITSKKNTVRANHYHPIQEQKCLVTEGRFISVFKNLLDIKQPIVTHVVNKGDITVTKPNVAHAMVFSENTTFLNLVRGEREHTNYGITHTIPHILVDEKLRKILLSGYKFECRVCGNIYLKRVISFGMMPLANNLENKINSKVEKFPLELNYCDKCTNCQLSYVVNPKKLFSNYLYTSSTSKTFINHFNKAADNYIKKLKLKKEALIIDIGSNDGIALKPFIDKGYKNVIGVEPAKNLSRIANKNKIKTINSFFNVSVLKKIKKKADLILASNVFAHSDKIDEIVRTIDKLLKPDGTFIIEIQYLINTLKDSTFDNIYHEHVNYWCLHSLQKYFKKFNFVTFDVEKINTHGGSLRVFIKKDIKDNKINSSIQKTLSEEKRFGIFNYKTFEIFRNKVERIKNNIAKNIKVLKNKNKIIAGFGAPAKATTAINYFGIEAFFDYVVEDNNLKHNKYIPGTKIKIISKQKVKKKIDYLIVLAWNYFKEIKKNNQGISKKIISIKELEEQ
jgi:nucleoside-diphosphate-sugar epimerase/2-polyprenyl-3-methyl-5-hydroxy-6-metoxy-1,4-benzoquinol methylase/quercetin dioxygenase-like cupin family protein